MERILGPLPKHMIEKTRYVLLVMSSVVVNTTGFRLLTNAQIPLLCQAGEGRMVIEHLTVLGNADTSITIDWIGMSTVLLADMFLGAVNL